MIYKECLHGLAPSCLAADRVLVTSMASRHLRSAESGCLAVTGTNTGLETRNFVVRTVLEQFASWSATRCTVNRNICAETETVSLSATSKSENFYFALHKFIHLVVGNTLPEAICFDSECLFFSHPPLMWRNRRLSPAKKYTKHQRLEPMCGTNNSYRHLHQLSPTLPYFSQGVKKWDIASDFSTPLAFWALWFKNRAKKSKI